MGDSFKLYIIYSSYSLEQISELLKSHTSSGLDIGPLRKDFTRDNKNNVYHESNRRFILMKKNIYISLSKAGFANKNNEMFYITEYEIRGENKAPRDSVMHFYFPNTETNNLSILSKMKFTDETGIINSEDYSVHDGIVEFSDKVPDYIRTIIKVAIDEKNCRVSWCKRFAYKNLSHDFDKY